MTKCYNITPCPSKGASKVGFIYIPSFCDVDKCVCPNLTCRYCEHCHFSFNYKRVEIAVNGYMSLKYGF